MNKWLVVTAALLATGCGDPTGIPEPNECSDTHACLVEGIDVAVAAFSVQATGVHAPTGLGMVQDTVRAEVVLRNRGTLPAAGGFLQVDFQGGFAIVPLPTLQPGAEQTVAVRVRIEDDLRLGETEERVSIVAAVTMPGDLAVLNNARTAGPFLVRAPMLHLSSSAGEGTAGATLPLTITLSNHSSTTASRPGTWALCLFDSFESCAPDGRSLTTAFTLPAVPPRSTLTTQVQVALPPESVYLDEAFAYEGYVCRVGDGQAHLSIDSPDSPCFSITGNVVVRPDYSLCAPPVVSATAVRLAVFNCGNPHLPRAQRRPPPFHLVAFDAVAGVTYRFDRSSGGSQLRFYDVRGEPVPNLAGTGQFRAGASERIYVVSYSSLPDVTFRAVEVP